MGGSSKGSQPRPETQATIYPSPQISPVEQPNPGAQTQYGQYYMPPGVEALRQSVLTQNGSMPFGVRSPFRQVDPSSNYASPRPPQIFKPSTSVPVVPMQLQSNAPSDSEIEQMRAELESMRAWRQQMQGNNGGGGN